MFMSKEEIAILNRFRELTALLLDLNMNLLANQITDQEAKIILEKIAFEEIDLEKRLKEIEDNRKMSKEHDGHINLNI